MRLCHQHLPGVEADSGAHGGDADDARLHEAPNHLHPLGADHTLREPAMTLPEPMMRLTPTVAGAAGEAATSSALKSW